MLQTCAGDVVLLVSKQGNKQFVRILEAGQALQTHRGMLRYDDLIGLPYGSVVHTHLGAPFFLFSVTTDDLIRNARRESQIIFPKDAGYIIMKMGIKPGSVVIEAGTGSGGLSTALATIVGETGHIYSYDIRPNMQRAASRNLRRACLEQHVTLKIGDANEGFEEQSVDAVFLDLREPWDALESAHAALRPAGILGCIVPTANQLIEMSAALTRHSGFAMIEAEELLLRTYKVVPARLRPDDQMVGHTGYLLFARKVIINAPPAQQDDET